MTKIVATFLIYCGLTAILSGLGSSLVVIGTTQLIFRPLGIEGLEALGPSVLMMIGALTAAFLALIPSRRFADRLIQNISFSMEPKQQNLLFIIAAIPGLISAYFILLYLVMLFGIFVLQRY